MSTSSSADAVGSLGQTIPRVVYGTAWKKDDTERLTALALHAGFRAIDTANQRKHYNEIGVGEAIKRAIADGLVSRDALFIQTKFTWAAYQDECLPFDPKADHATQVRESFASSLAHLHTDRIDSYVLHGPYGDHGIAAEDIAAWRAMEELHASGRVRFLGVSNVTLAQLEALHAAARVKPSFVQNRCYAKTGWDRAVRAFCAEHASVYQAFSLLTANRTELGGRVLTQIAKRVERTPAQIVFRFAAEVGMQALTGTSSEEHMREDLAGLDFTLSDEDCRNIEGVGER